MATTEPATVTTDPTTMTAERAAALRELFPGAPPPDPDRTSGGRARRLLASPRTCSPS